MLAGTLKHAAMDVIVQPSEVLPTSEKKLDQCQFWDGGVCCTNYSTALNEVSIFQDFT